MNPVRRGQPSEFQRPIWPWIVGFAGPLLCFVAWEQLIITRWGGSKDLEVRFIVADAVTGKPVTAATIDVNATGGLFNEAPTKPFQIQVDADGTARRVCRQMLTYGSESRLGFYSTYHVNRPWWTLRASAPGYQTSAEINLQEPRYSQQIEQASTSLNRLSISIALRKTEM
jgi:hypothetical protein